MHPVDCEVTGPDDVGIYRAGIFNGSILCPCGTTRDSISASIIVEAVSEDHWSVIVRGLAAVAPANVVAVVDLVINLDIELVIRSMRDAAENVVINWARQIGLRIKIEDGLADGVDFARGDYVWGPVVLHRLPA